MLETLCDAVTQLVEVDVSSLDDNVLHDSLIELQKQKYRIAAFEAVVLAQWDDHKIWTNNNSRSPGHRFARDSGLSVRDAKQLVNRARQLRDMPLCLQAFREGTLSTSRIDLLTSAYKESPAEAFARDEEVLVTNVRDLPFHSAVHFIEYWLQHVDPSQGEDKFKKQVEARSASISDSFEGTVDVKALFDPINGAIFRNELVRLEQQLFEADWAKARELYGETATADRLERTATQRRCDAMVLMATRSAAMVPGSIMPKPLLTVVQGRDAFDRTCELANGTVVAPGSIVPLLTTAQIERIVFDGPSRVLDVGHKRPFVGALRRALQVRDGYCQDPSGCDVPAEKCQGDHVFAHSKGGLTIQNNGQCMCGFHNRKKGTDPPPLAQTG